jgi:hypothetical protein
MAWVFDDHWRLAYATIAARFTYGGATATEKARRDAPAISVCEV